MGFVVPAKQEDNWGGSVLQFALSLAGKKQEEKQFEKTTKLKEREIENTEKAAETDKQQALANIEMAKRNARIGEERVMIDQQLLELQREGAVLAASGQKQAREKVQFEIDYLNGIKEDPNKMDQFFLQAALGNEVQALRAVVYQQTQENQQRIAAEQLKLDQEAAVNKAWESNYGISATELRSTPYIGEYINQSRLQIKDPTPERTQLLLDLLDKGANYKLEQEKNKNQQQAEMQSKVQLSTSVMKDLMDESDAFCTEGDHRLFRKLILEGKKPELVEADRGYQALLGLKNPWKRRFRVVGVAGERDAAGMSTEDKADAINKRLNQQGTTE